MKISIKNIGKLDEANFTLDKDLIVFIGPNNTGKTYAAYCLYGLNNVFWSNLPPVSDIFFSSRSISTLIQSGKLKMSIGRVFSEKNIDNALKKYNESFRTQLPTLFGLDSKHFEKSAFELSFESKYEFEQYFSQSTVGINAVVSNSFYTSFEKTSKDLLINITRKKDVDNPEETIRNILEFYIRSVFLPFGNSEWFFHPAERIGISVFSKDLFANRFARTNEILGFEIPNRDKVFELMRKEFNVYSKVVQDSISYYESILRTRYQYLSSKEYQSLSLELETKLLGGKIKIDSDGNPMYEYGENGVVKIQAAGTIIKSLAMLNFYLKHSAARGQTIIIDEPEINLHPDNQRLVARILAKLSKLGVRVIVSTHSDYFIRELNNLIMLNKEHPETSSLREKLRYDVTEILDHTKVGAYIFKDGKATALNVNESGMEAATIDEEINKLNNTSNTIYWTLFEN